MVELKRKAEEDLANNEALEEYKKKAAREMDQLQAQVDEARANTDRTDKSRKKLQAEVRASSLCRCLSSVCLFSVCMYVRLLCVCVCVCVFAFVCVREIERDLCAYVLVRLATKSVMSVIRAL